MTKPISKTPQIQTVLKNTEEAEQINEHHAECEDAVNSALNHALEAGRLLVETKAKCQHGEWQPWLAENVSFTPRTARTYMRLAKHRSEIETKTEGPSVLSIQGAVKLLTEPKTQRATPLSAAFETINRIDKITKTHDQLGEASILPEYDSLSDELHDLACGWPQQVKTCLELPDITAVQLQGLLSRTTVVVNDMEYQKLRMIATVGQLLSEEAAR